MKLNKNSLWIKFYLRFNDVRPTNFCDYFWGSLKSILIAIFTLIGLLFSISCLLSPVLLIWENFDRNSILGLFQVIGSATWLTAVSAFILYKILNYHIFPDKYKKPSVIKTWYKDFKYKHCTMITWK